MQASHQNKIEKWWKEAPPSKWVWDLQLKFLFLATLVVQV